MVHKQEKDQEDFQNTVSYLLTGEILQSKKNAMTGKIAHLPTCTQTKGLKHKICKNACTRKFDDIWCKKMALVEIMHKIPQGCNYEDLQTKSYLRKKF